MARATARFQTVRELLPKHTALLQGMPGGTRALMKMTPCLGPPGIARNHDKHTHQHESLSTGRGRRLQETRSSGTQSYDRISISGAPWKWIVRQRQMSLPDLKRAGRNTISPIGTRLMFACLKQGLASHNCTVELKRDIFMTEVEDEEVLLECLQRGIVGGAAGSGAQGRRWKINNTWQPPKHGVFNEALEARRDPRGNVDRVLVRITQQY
ncbi:hypothetical protein BKA83DRAFT_4125936 [Pisolithus microcarpus]|nr:hypothetical protein BKA83DRAFT_4125936 [Pisolithus microcarpus]